MTMESNSFGANLNFEANSGYFFNWKPFCDNFHVNDGSRETSYDSFFTVN